MVVKSCSKEDVVDEVISFLLRLLYENPNVREAKNFKSNRKKN
jgi:hypothetical protein